MKLSLAFVLLLCGLAAVKATDPRPSYYPVGQGVIGFEASLTGQVVKALPGALQPVLPGQITKPLPGQIVAALSGQVVGSLPGQMMASHPRYRGSLRNNP